MLWEDISLDVEKSLRNSNLLHRLSVYSRLPLLSTTEE